MIDVQVPATGCQEPLRAALEAWKHGKITGSALVEASRLVQLDMLVEYERRPLPSVPEELASYRALPRFERHQVTEVERRRLNDRHMAFLLQERMITLRNERGRMELLDLAAWSEAKGHPASVRAGIQASLSTHDDAVEV